MNRSQRIVLAAALLVFPTATPARDKVYETGKLIDLRSQSKSEACLAIQIGDISYLVHYVNAAPFLGGGFQPGSLIVGDPVEVRIKGDHLYLRLTQKKYEDEEKMRILRRERVTPEKPPATCAVPVEVGKDK
jgi:hypothetical protein